MDKLYTVETNGKGVKMSPSLCLNPTSDNVYYVNLRVERGMGDCPLYMRMGWFFNVRT
jgi:hypothetical protein